MVNWQSVVTLKTDIAIDEKLSHLASGIYIWEWATNLDFDYRLATQSKKLRWTTAVYLICRLTALLTVILDIVVINVTHNINCHVIYKFFWGVGYISALASSILIALRTIAIWKQNKYISWLLILTLIAYSGLLLYAEIVASDARWNELDDACSTLHVLAARSNFTFALVFDAGSLILALVGARLFWSRTSGGLFVTIYHQGIMWIVIVVVSYTIPLVFLWLDLNEFMNVLFQVPSGVSLTIAATRMYRGLYEAGRSDVVQFLEPTRSGGFRADDTTTMEMTSVKSSTRNVSLPETDQSTSKSISRCIQHVDQHERVAVLS